jgi:hypothetical protein
MVFRRTRGLSVQPLSLFTLYELGWDITRKIFVIWCRQEGEKCGSEHHNNHELPGRFRKPAKKRRLSNRFELNFELYAGMTTTNDIFPLMETGENPACI